MSTSAGWYADPGGRTLKRYWDGTSWTMWLFDGVSVSGDAANGARTPQPFPPLASPQQPPAQTPPPPMRLDSPRPVPVGRRWRRWLWALPLVGVWLAYGLTHRPAHSGPDPWKLTNEHCLFSGPVLVPNWAYTATITNTSSTARRFVLGAGFVFGTDVKDGVVANINGKDPGDGSVTLQPNESADFGVAVLDERTRGGCGPSISLG